MSSWLFAPPFILLMALGAADSVFMTGTTIFPTGFYVYALVDPRDDAIFYIGKGRDRRAWQHEAGVRRGEKPVNAKKVERIRSILDAGLATAVRIVAEYDFEDDAFEHEIELISATPNLTNLRAGGEGCCLDPATIARRALARAERIAKRQKQAKIDHVHAAKNKAASKRERTFMAIAGDRHAAEVAAWLDDIRTKGTVTSRRAGHGVTVKNILAGSSPR